VLELPGLAGDFSPDGERLLVKSHDATRVHRWGALDEIELVVTADSTRWEGRLPDGFSPDGRWLDARSFGTIHRWSADVAGTLEKARDYAARLDVEGSLDRYEHLLAPRVDDGD
jgi:hypothetical protein